jgi:hypothetical protein
MSWDTHTEQDRDGHWVVVNVGNPYDQHRIGPFASQEDVEAALLLARTELHRRHGPPS